LESLEGDVDINRALETNRVNIKYSAKESPGYYEFKHLHYGHCRLFSGDEGAGASA
jgi:hypothetical protein